MRIRSIFTLIILLLTTPLALAENNFASRPSVQAFVHEMVKRYHFNQKELLALFSNVQVRPKVMSSIRAPLEQRPWYIYQMAFITESRIRQGVDFWNKNEDVLERAERIYGVPASIIVATIGVETKYGKNTGDFRVIDALANIAFSESRRAPYFRSELKEFLLLTREQHLDPLKVMGSYAGAIGQPQFMPSSYRHYAVNFSGNKHIDLSHNESDIIGSIANYYKQHGWQEDDPVAIPASLAKNKSLFAYSSTKQLYVPPSELMKYVAAGGKLPKNKKAKLLQLQGYYGSEYWLSFHNFDVIKQYNTSNLYAMAVYQLSYYIESLRERT